MLETLLLERGLLALALGGFRRLDAHTRFALGCLARLLDLQLRFALGTNARFLRFACCTLGGFLLRDSFLLGRADGRLLFLHAVLFDLTKLAEGEQNRVFALLALGH
ncbi:MAG: hypothetical protein AB7T06_47350 [Kofleriaceae bacterium]